MIGKAAYSFLQPGNLPYAGTYDHEDLVRSALQPATGRWYAASFFMSFYPIKNG
jgi:hypothetical protein